MAQGLLCTQREQVLSLLDAKPHKGYKSCILLRAAAAALVSTALLTDQVTGCHKRHVPAAVPCVLDRNLGNSEAIVCVASPRWEHLEPWVFLP